MTSKSIKKIGIFCLGFASFTLAGCFHVPDEDRLPNKNNTKTGNIEKNNELNQAFDEFINNFNTLSDQRDEMKNEKIKEIETEILINPEEKIISNNLEDINP